MCEHFKAQWLLYVPLAVTLKISASFPQSIFLCFVWFSEWERLFP